MPQISIIVPVYNAEKYLPKCIDSLLSQTFKDIEIILINDGSTDSSPEICEKYSIKDQRIIVVSKENEGLAKARQDGIEKAHADYISFLDSDDYYEPTFCETMFNRMVKVGADLVECDYYKEINDSRMEHRLYVDDMGLSQKMFYDRTVRKNIVNGTEAVVVWNKLYRKSIIECAIVDYGSSPLEDYVFNAQYYTMVERYEYVHQCLTNYRQVPMSLSRKCNLQTYEILKKSEAIKVHCLEKMGMVTEVDKREDAFWFVNYTVNFLNQYLLSDEPYSDDFIRQILMDEMLCGKCTQISTDNRFAYFIATGRTERAIQYLKNKAQVDKMKILLSKIKRVFF